jgi:soluble lytic murein transglycosylase
VRAALRASRSEAERWALVTQSIQAMPAGQRSDPAWVYWLSRALRAGTTGVAAPVALANTAAGTTAASPPAAPAAAGSMTEADARTSEARRLLESIASPLHFYGKLAADELGRAPTLPAPPSALTPEERAAARQNLGLSRALDLIALGLRPEGVREWNFTLRGMDDRALLAAAERACEREVWDRCINTSDRTRQEIHLGQRFPTPFRAEVTAAAREIGLDPAVVYGLIRQESRFITDARSSVGASGLMQLMPATAQWTARKIGLPYTASMITDQRVNLRLGSSYLKLVLDDFEGSMAMAAAAYNAGPSRPRRWREGARLETAAWAETIPFPETRDYVKKVLSNASIYAALLEGTAAPALRPRLGGPIGPIGPRSASGAAPNLELP